MPTLPCQSCRHVRTYVPLSGGRQGMQRNEYGFVRSRVRPQTQHVLCFAAPRIIGPAQHLYSASERRLLFIYFFWFGLLSLCAVPALIPYPFRPRPGRACMHAEGRTCMHAAPPWPCIVVDLSVCLGKCSSSSTICSAGHLAEPAGALDETRKRETAQPKGHQLPACHGPDNVRVN